MLHVTSKTSLSHPRGPKSHSSNSTRNAQLERHIQYLSSTLPNSQLNLLDTTIYKACPGSGIPENFWTCLFFLFKKWILFVCCYCTYSRYLTHWINYFWNLVTLSALCIFVIVPYFVCVWGGGVVKVRKSSLVVSNLSPTLISSTQSHLPLWNLNCTFVQ